MKRAMAVVGLVSGAGAAAATVEWNRTPIGVVLEVGIEQQVRFAGKASVGVPAELAETGALSTLFANDTAYWTAQAPFDRRRVAVRLDDTGEFILFDVEAVPAGFGGGGSAEPLEVVVARPGEGREEAKGGGESDVRGGLVDLIRFVARMDLGPRRLVGARDGIVAVEAELKDVTALYRHPDVLRTVWTVQGQWARGGLFVTAVEVANVGDVAIEVDPRHFQFSADGAWNGASRGFVAVGCARYALSPVGHVDSTTTLYVVTEQPFDRAVVL